MKGLRYQPTDYFTLLYNKYNKLFLTKEEVANELGFSEKTLDRRMKEGEYRTFERRRGAKGKYFFHLGAFCKELERLERIKLSA